MSRVFRVYGLIDPRDDRVFYVGWTGNLRQRMVCHSHCDPASPSYHTVMALRAERLRFRFCIFGEFPDRDEARRLERILILSMPGLSNNNRGYGILSTKKVPVADLDYSMLAAAILPFPKSLAYVSAVPRANSDVGPMVHREGAYEYP